MLILGLETSCDETGVALYKRGRGIVGEALASQTSLHAPFGGVVPELASRDHIAKLAPMIESVLAHGGRSLGEIDGIAYTAGPGLVGALMVGASLTMPRPRSYRATPVSSQLVSSPKISIVFTLPAAPG